MEQKGEAAIGRWRATLHCEREEDFNADAAAIARAGRRKETPGNISSINSKKDENVMFRVASQGRPELNRDHWGTKSPEVGRTTDRLTEDGRAQYGRPHYFYIYSLVLLSQLALLSGQTRKLGRKYTTTYTNIPKTLCIIRSPNLLLPQIPHLMPTATVTLLIHPFFQCTLPSVWGLQCS